MMNEIFLCNLLGGLAQGFITWLYFEFLFARRERLSTIIVYFVIGYVILFGTSWYGLDKLYFLPFFGINLFLLWQNYGCRIKTAVLHVAFLTFIVTIAQELVLLGLSLALPDLEGYSDRFDVIVPVSVLTRLLYLVLSQFGARYFKPHKGVHQEPQLMVLFCSLPVLSAVISVLVFFMKLGTQLSKPAEIMIAIMELGLLVVNLIFFVLYNYLQKTSAEHLKLQLSVQKDETDATYYQTLKAQSENQRILIHDIKNHLRTLDCLAHEGKMGEISDYIEKLETDLGPTNPIRLCDDPILNTVLLHTSEECKRKHIRFECDVRARCTTFMDAPAITSLYGNLLSNAVESAASSEDRMVEITVTTTSAQSVLIAVVNSCDFEPVRDSHGRFLTKKREPEVHGVGLKSIERIVEKHNGIHTMYYDEETRTFHHVIQFPQ